MPPRRLFILGPATEPRWMGVSVQHLGDAWARLLLADDALPPERGALKRLPFIGETAAAKQEAR